MAEYKQGLFKPINPSKYRGNPTNIVYRSSWELRLMSYFDTKKEVVWWQSEESPIAYICPTDGRRHRYYPDFVIGTADVTGKITITMIEVKPKKETIEPVRKKGGHEEKFIREVMKWGKNSAKWEAAREVCKDRGWNFLIMTEEQIFGTSKPQNLNRPHKYGSRTKRK